MNREDTVKQITDLMISGKIAPWKAEDVALQEGISTPDNITAAVEARRAFVEEKSGHQFHHIVMPEKPYHVGYRCPNDGTLWTLAADDTYIRCGDIDNPHGKAFRA